MAMADWVVEGRIQPEFQSRGAPKRHSRAIESLPVSASRFSTSAAKKMQLVVFYGLFATLRMLGRRAILAQVL